MNMPDFDKPTALMDIARDLTNPIGKPPANMAEQIAKAASAFEQQRTGVLPKSVTVVLSDHTLVITLHGALSPAEQALARTPAGAAQVQQFHRQLFASASDSLKQEIKKITGVEVRETAVDVEPASGVVVGVFTTGTTVQVYLLTQSVRSETWTGSASDIAARITTQSGQAGAIAATPRPNGGA